MSIDANAHRAKHNDARTVVLWLTIIRKQYSVEVCEKTNMVYLFVFIVVVVV